MTMQELPATVLTFLDKRIVLLHCEGPWKDVYQIMGLESDHLKELEVDQMPGFAEGICMGDGRIADASLLKVTPRMIVYRETTPPTDGGKFNDFHPEQV
jgi:hypothetical protein